MGIVASTNARMATFIVAASDASALSKSGADYVCDYEDADFPFDFDFDDSCRIDLGDVAHFASELWLECARYPDTGCGL